MTVYARRATAADATVIACLLETGSRPVEVTEDQVSGTIEAGSHTFILSHGSTVVGIAELRAVHTEPERSDAAGVVWMVQNRPLGVGVAALCFILRYAFETLQLREVWGWVRQDNAPMLRLCRHLGIRDHGTWAGNPECRLMTFDRAGLQAKRDVLSRLGSRIRVILAGPDS